MLEWLVDEAVGGHDQVIPELLVERGVQVQLVQGSAHVPEPGVALSVADTGCGIPSDLLSRVVEPFFTTKSPDKGTGLGLSQVYGFARRSDGTVTINSEMGRGTKVTVYLPRSHAAVVAPSPEAAQ